MLFPHPAKMRPPSNHKAETHLRRAEALLESGELEAALSLASAARQAFQDSDMDESLAQAERLLGDILVQLGQPALALPYYKQAARRMERPTDAAACWMRLAEANEQLGRRVEAIDAYREARRLYRALKLEQPRLDATYRVAYLYYELEDWRNAEKFYRRALELASQLGQADMRDDILLELGNSVAHLGRLSEARRLFEQSAAHARATADEHVLAAALHGLGVTLAQAGRHEIARSMYEQSLRLKLTQDNNRCTAFTLYEMGMNEAALDRIDCAMRLVQQAVHLYEEIEAPEAEVARAGLARLKAEAASMRPQPRVMQPLALATD